mmetsp:Transcript_21218/g.36213  ORF Transcript_21218/g.36213 Transcript_21218/m.36213 type:complete len:347 (-) Transcript_21218:400-1440(-)
MIDRRYTILWTACMSAFVLVVYLGHTLQENPTNHSFGRVKKLADSTGGSSRESSTGPLPFCEAVQSLVLYRTEMTSMLCQHKRSISVKNSSEKLSIVFIHIPKTGGESLEAALSLTKSHAPAFRRKPRLNAKGSLSITIIRNPFSRMYSWFRFCLHGWRGRLPGPTTSCLKAHQFLNEQYHKTNAPIAVAFEHWLEYIFAIRGDEHWIARTAVNYLADVEYPSLLIDYYIRFEHYEDDFSRLSHAIGLNNTNLTHENSSEEQKKFSMSGENVDNLLNFLRARDLPLPGEKESLLLDTTKINTFMYKPELWKLLQVDYRQVYTVKSINLVSIWFAQDLQIFNYTFEG